jgi:hypothetical protein
MQTATVPALQAPDYLLISKAAAAAFAAVRLLQFRVARQFLFLFSYLIVSSLYDSVLSILNQASKTYFWTFMSAEPWLLCVAVLAVREMFALIFEDYPGLRTAGRWALYAALIASLLIFLAFFRLPWAHESPNTRLLFYELALDRLIHFSLALIIMVQLYFLSHYPLHLDRNTRTASGFFGAMFLVESAAHLLDTLTPNLHLKEVDYFEVAFSALCFLGWGLMLRGATAPLPRADSARQPREAELLQQLESLNEMLSRSGRR